MVYSRGFHVWQFQSREVDTGAFEVGFATKDVDVDSGELLGYDSETFGWSKMLNLCRHNFPEFAAWRTPVMLEGVVRGQDEDEQFIISDNFYCILDMDEGYLAFATDDHYSGVAFRGLKGKTLYPIVATWNRCEITMKYLGGLNLSDKLSPCSRKGCTRIVISDYCKECSNECQIEHVDEKVGELLSPAHPLLYERPEDNFRRPHKLDIIIQSTPPNEEIQNPDDRSQNIAVNDDDKFNYFTVGKMSYSRGFHVWQLQSTKLNCIYVGVATNDAPMDCGKIIGFDQESYGWNVFLNNCYHDYPRFDEWTFPVGVKGEGTFELRDKLYLILDMDEGCLSFATDEQFLGVAFRGLKGKALFPIISTYWDDHGFTIKYLGGMNLLVEPSRCSGKDCSRLVISSYCKKCSAECVIDHVKKGSGDEEEMNLEDEEEYEEEDEEEYEEEDEEEYEEEDEKEDEEEIEEEKYHSNEQPVATDSDAKLTRAAVDCVIDHDEKGSGDGEEMKKEEDDGKEEGKNHSNEQPVATDSNAKSTRAAVDCVIDHDFVSGDRREMKKEQEDAEKIEDEVNEEEILETGCFCSLVKMAWYRLRRWIFCA